MKTAQFAAKLSQSDIQREIIGDYRGAYSLSLTSHPENRNQLAVRVQVEGQDTVGIARQITIDGTTLPVIVSTNFRVPQPLVGASKFGQRRGIGAQRGAASRKSRPTPKGSSDKTTRTRKRITNDKTPTARKKLLTET